MIGLTKFSLRRPVTVILALFTIAYFGIQGLMGSKVELTPEMEMPVLIAYTVYAGASPDDINDGAGGCRRSDCFHHTDAVPAPDFLSLRASCRTEKTERMGTMGN